MCTLTLYTNKKHMSPNFLSIALLCVLLKVSPLAARVLVTEMKHWHRNLSYGGDRAKSLAATSSDWQPPGRQGCQGQAKA